MAALTKNRFLDLYQRLYINTSCDSNFEKNKLALSKLLFTEDLKNVPHIFAYV